MWYAVETVFIKGIQYKSKLMFNKDVDPNYKGIQPGTCLAYDHEEPHNTCQTFLDGEIEIYTDWFQTKTQATQFKNGGITYIVHKEIWYDKGLHSVLSRFIKWETVPALGKYLPFRGVYEHHYREGKDNMLTDLLQALMTAKNEKDKETAYRNLEIVGMDRTTADIIIAEMKKEKENES